MGMRLHAAKVYKVEWNCDRGFNYKTEEFHNLLDKLEVDYSGETFDNDFEVDVNEWNKGINLLKEYNGGNNSLDKAIERLECPINSIIEIMEKLYEDGDKDDGYLHLAFF